MLVDFNQSTSVWLCPGGSASQGDSQNTWHRASAFFCWMQPSVMHAVQLRCGDVLVMRCSLDRAELMGMCLINRNAICAVKVSSWCAVACAEMNSWACTFNPSEKQLRCGYVPMMCCIRDRVGLTGMHFKSFRMSSALWRCLHYVKRSGQSWTHACVLNQSDPQFRRGCVCTMCCSLGWVKLMRLCFKSIWKQFTVWMCRLGALWPGQSWANGDAFRFLQTVNYSVKISPCCAAFGKGLNSRGWILIPSGCRLRRGGVFVTCCSLGGAEVMGMSFKSVRIDLRGEGLI